MIAVLERLIEQNQRQPALIAAALVEALRTVGLGDLREEKPIVPSHGTVGQSTGHHAPRPKTASDKVREHLQNNPEDRGLSVRELAMKLGIGKSTVQRVYDESTSVNRR